MERRGVTLVEVLLCVFILSLIAVPLFELFSTSKKMVVSARDRTVAMNLASSYVAGLSEVPEEEIYAVAAIRDTALSGRLSLTELKLEPSPAPFERKVAVVDLEPDSTRPRLYLAVVTVAWESRVSGVLLKYSLYRLL